MVTTDSTHNSVATRNRSAVPRVPGGSRSSADRPAPSALGLDRQLAPLRKPALVLGAALLCIGLVALVPLRAWWHDYGGVLVVAAYLQYMALAGTLEIWGIRMTRKDPLASDPDHAPGSASTGRGGSGAIGAAGSRR